MASLVSLDLQEDLEAAEQRLWEILDTPPLETTHGRNRRAEWLVGQYAQIERLRAWLAAEPPVGAAHTTQRMEADLK